jgi:hypothetical protein
VSQKNGKPGVANAKRGPKPAPRPAGTMATSVGVPATEIAAPGHVAEPVADDTTSVQATEPSDSQAPRPEGWSAAPARWLGEGLTAARQVESRLPGPLPVALGAGALAVVGVLEWSVVLGGAGLYGAYRLIRSVGASPS